MRISVIIPCHNVEAFLGESLASVLAQNRPADEVIVVDDGSTDGSLAIARQYQASAPEVIRVLSAAFHQGSRARNLGALEASGDALMFLDADDVLGEGALGGLEAVLSGCPGGIAIAPWLRLERDGPRWTAAPRSCKPRLPRQDALSAWLTGWYHPPCSVLWSRTAFENAGRWDEHAAINQDGDLIMRALVAQTPLVEATTGVAYYRRSPNASVSASRLTPAGLNGRLRAIAKIGWLLEARGTVSAYASALRRALTDVARDAGAEHAPIRDEALKLARQYRRRSWLVTTQAAPVHSPPTHRPWSPPRPRAINRPSRYPVVSVVIPAHNRAHCLAPTLTSVLTQSFTDFEVLVVDDASTDDTRSVVSGVSDARVRYLRQPTNLGVAAARNRGIRESKGELIAFLDSDDEWSRDKLTRQVNKIRAASASVGLCYTGVETVHEDGTSSIQRPEARGDVHRSLLWHNAIHGGGSNVMIRRAVVATAGFFNETLPAIEDYEYWLRISRFFHVDFEAAPLVRYYDRNCPERRSRALQANLDARWWLYQTYGAHMRRLGVAHLFLLQTVRWAVTYAQADASAVRRFAVRAVIERPSSRMALATLIGNLIPTIEVLPWVQRHAVTKLA